MGLNHCDVCGTLMGADVSAPDGADVGLLCELCLRTRRVVPDLRPRLSRRSARFRCPHCDRKLRPSKPVRSRIEIDCPRCRGGLVLLPGGAVEPGPAKGLADEASPGPSVADDPGEPISAGAFDALAASDALEVLARPPESAGNGQARPG